MAFAVINVVQAKTVTSSAQAAPVVVNVASVTIQSMPKQVASLGSLTALQEVTISSVVDGRVDQINFKDGDEVAKGMPIVQLNNDTAKADLATAQSKLDVTTKKYIRSKGLLNIAVSQQDLDQLEANVSQARANVQSKQALLNQKTISAPFSGALAAFKVQEGDYVTAGDAIVTLVNATQLKAQYTLSENLLPELKKGQLVKITVSAYPNKTFYGTVNYIAPTINQATRAVAVQASVPNKDALLNPGMFIHVEQQIEIDKKALVVPQQAVTADVKGYYVYKIVSGKAIQTRVKLGSHVGNVVQILSGLQAGDQVVIAGQQKLSDGVSVQVVNTAAPAPSTTTMSSSAGAKANASTKAK